METPGFVPGEMRGDRKGELFSRFRFLRKGWRALVRFGRKAMEERKELSKTYLPPYFSFSFIKKKKKKKK